MALIMCLECGHDISSTALSCPRCGYRRDPSDYEPYICTQRHDSLSLGGWLAALGILLLIFSFMVWFVSERQALDWLWGWTGLLRQRGGVP